MSIAAGMTITKLFVVENPSTRAAVDADALPTGELYVAGAADAATVTVSHISTGLYKASILLPALTDGQVCDLVVSYSISSVAIKDVVWSDAADALDRIRKVLFNRLETDPATGQMTLYDDDSETALMSCNLWEGTDMSQAYRGAGINRREQLT